MPNSRQERDAEAISRKGRLTPREKTKHAGRSIRRAWNEAEGRNCAAAGFTFEGDLPALLAVLLPKLPMRA